MIERAEKKLYLDAMVTRDGSNVPGSGASKTISDNEDADLLMKTLRFGCNAVFGQDSGKQTLPTCQDIETITDRNRTENFSRGNLQGAVESNAKDFDAMTEFTDTTKFGGIDFKKIRQDYSGKKKLKDMGEIRDVWRKRQRKNRIKLVNGMNSGYGKALVPVLASNDYDLETGEKSVFDRELKDLNQIQKRKKNDVSFESQDFCQVCGDGGELVLCRKCPISVHPRCVGVSRAKDFQWCSHHYCLVCQKSSAYVGGFLFPCSACPAAYCEDHLPKEDVVILGDGCERMSALGYTYKHGVYCLCSKICVNVAKTEWNWKPPEVKPRPPCPPPLELSSFFGGQVDDSVHVPVELVEAGKRQRKPASKHAS